MQDKRLTNPPSRSIWSATPMQHCDGGAPMDEFLWRRVEDELDRPSGSATEKTSRSIHVISLDGLTVD